MTRRSRLIRNILIGVAAGIAALILAAVIFVGTPMFRDYVRNALVSQIESSTGGRANIGSLSFDVRHLRAAISDLAIHGTEAAGAPPLLAIRRVEVDLQLLPGLKRLYGISFLGVDHPVVNVTLNADGRTNVPSPKRAPNGSPLQSVIDLAVGRFRLQNGDIHFLSVRQPLTLEGSNLHARLDFSEPKQSYQGEIGVEPAYILNNRKTPVPFRVTIPVTIGKDSITVRDASIENAASRILLDASFTDLKNPRLVANVQGRIAGLDLVNAAALPIPPKQAARMAPLQIEGGIDLSDGAIELSSFIVRLGRSQVKASGVLKGDAGAPPLRISAMLNSAELTRLLNSQIRAAGDISISAEAKLDAAGLLQATGSLKAPRLDVIAPREKLPGISVASGFRVRSRDLDLNDIRVRALGGEFTGNGSAANLNQFKIAGDVRGFDVASAAGAVGLQSPYSGAITGKITAEGNLQQPAKSLAVNARLAVEPGRRGLPLSGRVNIAYSGSTGNIVVERSHLSLPHTQLNFSGSLSARLNVSLISRDLGDLFAAAPSLKALPVALAPGGEASFNGAVTGSLTNPRIAGELALNRFDIKGRQFRLLTAGVAASSALLRISNATLLRDNMEARADATLGLRNWSPGPHSRLAANLTLAHADLADIAVLAGQPAADYSGALSANARLDGTWGNPVGTVAVQASDGSIQSQPFRAMDLRASLTDQLVEVPGAYLDTPAGRVDLTAEFRHPRNDFSAGRVQAHVQAANLNLSQIALLNRHEAPAAGTLAFQADVTGELRQAQPPFLLQTVNGSVNAAGVRLRGVDYGGLTATAQTHGQTVSFDLASTFAGSAIHATGGAELRTGYPMNADIEIARLPIERALAAAGTTSIPASGILAGTVHAGGSVTAPQGSAALTLSHALIAGEPIDEARVRVNYLPQSIEIPQLAVQAGGSRLDLTATYDHPAGTFDRGQLRFTLASNQINLNRLPRLQKLRSGLGGALELHAEGRADVRTANPKVLLSSLNANVTATNLSVNSTPLGNLTLTAGTEPNNVLTFALNSSIAGAAVQGRGTVALNSQYPVDAQLSFHDVEWKRISDLIGPESLPVSFDAAAAGDATLRGPLTDVSQLNGSLNLSQLQATVTPPVGQKKAITITNQGPIAVDLRGGELRIVSAHVAGPGTDLQASGTARLTGTGLDLSVHADTDLSIVQNLAPSFYALGNIAFAATLRGDLPKPLINGQITIRDAAVNAADIPVGVSNANATIVFNGNTAQIRTFTAESGGGEITLTGFAAWSNALRFAVSGSATNVRVRVQEGVSVWANASLRLAGAPDRSLASGTATVTRVSYASQNDFGSILSRAAPPIQVPSAPSPLLSGMKLDVIVRNIPAMPVESNLSSGVQADIDLRVRGTAAEPAVQGRVTISEGKLLFFGTTYTVNTGTISFYDPSRIQPVLNISLEAQVQGVTVTVHVTGPFENLKLSYTSDPPLQFREILGLLAGGTTPTSDPTILASQPNVPQQSLQQLGESAVLGQAVGSPVANRLQRVFGITQLKIDPTFATSSGVPTARIALQQQITPNVTFTYVSAVDVANTTLIRMEWAFSSQYSAVATRDQNGIFSLVLFYKRQFR